MKEAPIPPGYALKRTMRILREERDLVLLRVAFIVVGSVGLGWIVSQGQFLLVLTAHSVGNLLLILFSIVICRDKNGNIHWLAPPFIVSVIFILQYVIPGFLLALGAHVAVWPHRWDLENVITVGDFLL